MASNVQRDKLKTLSLGLLENPAGAAAVVVQPLDDPRPPAARQASRPDVSSGLWGLVEGLLQEQSRPRGEEGGVSPQEAPAVF